MIENKKNIDLKDDLKEQKTEYDLREVSSIVKMFKEVKDENNLKHHIRETIKKITKESNIEGKYSFVFLYDPINSISEHHSNKIYSDILKESLKKDILMFIDSSGGEIEPAYLISKICKKHSKQKFIVTVPRKAKSAATLISLGADEIHMGDLSELGPIDPQFNGVAVQSISDALIKISKIIKEYPESSAMFSNYLSQSLELKNLGIYERVNESATQYAERLLESKKDFFNHESVANHFTNHYKDHGFVIDYSEASKILTDNVIKVETEEYKLSNNIYIMLDLLNLYLNAKLNKSFYILGTLDEKNECVHFN